MGEITKKAATAREECPECRGSGIVIHLSEFSHFEDKRPCRLCETGKKVEAKIAEIIARAQADERSLRF